MNNKILNSLIKILLFCAIFTICSITNVSQAVTNGFTELVNSPSITITKPSNKKLEAIKVTIKAPMPAIIKENKFYVDNKEITLNPSSNNNNAEMIYKIPKSVLPKKNKTKTIKIQSRSINTEIIYKVVNVTNKNGKYYVLDNAPNITNIQYSDKNIVISIKSKGEKINAIEVLDTNNNKMVYSNKKLANKTPEIKLDKSNLSLKNDAYYRIKLSVSDKNGAYAVKNIAFKLPEDAEVKDDNKISETSCTHKNLKYTTTETQHTKICKDCGKTIETKNHMFEASTGKCKTCSYECKHKDTRYIITESTHKKVCTTCGKEWKEENHNISNNKCTVCKTDTKDKLAKVTTYTSPEIKMESNENKLADITLTITSSKKIKNVKVYEVDSKGNNKKELKLSPKTNKSTEKKYVLSDKDLLKGSTHYFYITVKNEYGITTKYYRIKKATNNKKVEYYAIDSAPRMTIGTTTFNEKLQLELKDGSGLGYVKIYDVNNNNKLIISQNNLSTTRDFLQINLSKFQKSNQTYKLKFEAKDAGSTSLKLITKVVEIKLEDTKLNISTTNNNNLNGNNTNYSDSNNGTTSSTVCKHSEQLFIGCTPENSSWHIPTFKCKSCGKTLYSNKIKHSFSGNKCTECGYTLSCNHTSSPSGYKNYGNSTYHLMIFKCSKCNKVTSNPLQPHIWTQVGNAYKYCKKCNKTEKIK